MACTTSYLNSADISFVCPDDETLVLFVDSNNLAQFHRWGDIKNCIGAAVSKKPLIGITGNGGADDPVTDSSFFESDKLQDIGAENNGYFQIEIDGVILQNFGTNIGFTFDSGTNIIDISPNTFPLGSSLYIDLNQ